MPGNILEIASEGRSVHLERGFISIRADGKPIGRLPIDDIDAVIAASQSVMWSGRVLAALAERGVPVVLVGPNYAPVSHLTPVVGHYAQGERFEAQAAVSLPTKKRIWATIVKGKILAQAEALGRVDARADRLVALAAQVRSGDSTNREAVAARFYWSALMGDGFRRDRDSEGLNGFLNYGYAVLRAAAARGVVGAGLHPSLALHHKSGGDGLRLADDIMEPFRPAVDLLALQLSRNGETELAAPQKKILAAVLNADLATSRGRTPISVALVRMAQSLAGIFMKSQSQLDMPSSFLPLKNTGEQAE